MEIEISSLPDKEWQRVVNTDTYFDRDERKLRDIDVYAFDIFSNPRLSPLELEIGMPIECKKMRISGGFFH